MCSDYKSVGYNMESKQQKRLTGWHNEKVKIRKMYFDLIKRVEKQVQHKNYLYTKEVSIPTIYNFTLISDEVKQVLSMSLSNSGEDKLYENTYNQTELVGKYCNIFDNYADVEKFIKRKMNSDKFELIKKSEDEVNFIFPLEATFDGEAKTLKFLFQLFNQKRKPEYKQLSMKFVKRQYPSDDILLTNGGKTITSTMDDWNGYYTDFLVDGKNPSKFYWSFKLKLNKRLFVVGLSQIDISDLYNNWLRIEFPSMKPNTDKRIKQIGGDCSGIYDPDGIYSIAFNMESKIIKTFLNNDLLCIFAITEMKDVPRYPVIMVIANNSATLVDYNLTKID